MSNPASHSVDLGEAVNLARNITTGVLHRSFVTPEGIDALAEAVLLMDAALKHSHGVLPAEPTPEMIQAWHDRHVEGAGYIDRNSIEYALYVECYRAMLKAAPQSNGP